MVVLVAASCFRNADVKEVKDPAEVVCDSIGVEWAEQHTPGLSPRRSVPREVWRTELRMIGLRHWIDIYRSRHQCRLPDHIAELGPEDPAEPTLAPFERFYLDGWGRQFLYKRVGTGMELRSAGADGQMETPDDMIFSWAPQDGR